MNNTKFQPWKNAISYCVYCNSTILWNSHGSPSILKLGNNQVFDCMQYGCSLIIKKTPENYSDAQQLASLLLILVEQGIPSDVAESAALELIENRMAA